VVHLLDEPIFHRVGRHVDQLVHHVGPRHRGSPASCAQAPGSDLCLSVAGDEPHAKEVVLRLVDALGFDGIDAGTLADSWRQQPGAPAYCRDLDAPALKVALEAADASQIDNYRAQADEIARPYFTRLVMGPRSTPTGNQGTTPR
jgi:hypothetical protein